MNVAFDFLLSERTYCGAPCTLTSCAMGSITRPAAAFFNDLDSRDRGAISSVHSVIGFRLPLASMNREQIQRSRGEFRTGVPISTSRTPVRFGQVSDLGVARVVGFDRPRTSSGCCSPLPSWRRYARRSEALQQIVLTSPRNLSKLGV